VSRWPSWDWCLGFNWGPDNLPSFSEARANSNEQAKQDIWMLQQRVTALEARLDKNDDD